MGIRYSNGNGKTVEISNDEAIIVDRKVMKSRNT